MASDTVEEDLRRLTENLSDLRGKIEGRTFLITGGAGFLGSWFCDAVLNLGGRVVCVDNLSSGSEKNVEHLLQHENFRLVKGDVLDYEHEEKADYIVNMASIATPGLYMEKPIETLDANIHGTRKLLDIARSDGAKGFLLTSTSEVYGNPPDERVPTDEEFQGMVSPFGPRSMYDEGKRAAEAYCYSYYQKHGLPVRVARIFNTYGPRLDVKSTSQYGRALIKFVQQAINGDPITVYGDGRQTRSFCYITDQIEGLFRLLLTPGLDGHVVNIGNPAEFKIKDLADMVVGIAGSGSTVELNSKPNYNLKDDPRRRSPDISRAKELLGYQPRVHLEDGLQRVVRWMNGG